MPPRKKPDVEDVDIFLPPPATTIEGRNDQLTSLAFTLAEKRLANGTASAQEVVHFLKAGSPTQRLLEEKLRRENTLLETRVKELESRTSGEELMNAALAAFKGYAGQEPTDPEGDEYDDPYLQ